MRIWAKILKDNRLVSDMTVENNDAALNRTRKIYASLDEVCYSYNLSKPMWLDKNIKEFKKNSRTRFTQDNFIDAVDFDYLEMQVIDE